MPFDQYIIDCKELGDYRTRLESLLELGQSVGSESFFSHSMLLADDLPEEQRKFLYEFSLKGNKHGVLLFQNLPHDHGSEATCDYSGCVNLAMIASRLGEVIGYQQEKDGALFQDVKPVASFESEQASYGSKVELEFHTERCFHPFLPDYVLLYCIRSDSEGGGTFFASIREVLDNLPDRVVEELFRPQFQTGVDYSFGNLTTEKANGPVMSVLHGDRKDPFLRFDLDLMCGLNDQAQSALECLASEVENVRRTIHLQPGELLVIDNHRAIHGRASFQPQYDGNDRWLKRCYVQTDIKKSAGDRSDYSQRGQISRVINTSFAQYL